MRKSKLPKKVKTFGDFVMTLRIINNYKLYELAKAIGISESYLSRIERNKQMPGIKIVSKLSHWLCFSLYIFHKEGDMILLWETLDGDTKRLKGKTLL